MEWEKSEFVKRGYEEVIREGEQTLTNLEAQTYNSEDPHDNLLKCNSRVQQKILKLYIHPTFYNM